MVELLATDNYSGYTVNLVSNFQTRHSTYKNHRIDSNMLTAILCINDECLVVPLTVIRKRDLQPSDTLTYIEKPKICTQCREETHRYIEANTSEKTIIEMIEEINTDKKLVLSGKTEEYHCIRCFRNIQSILYESIQQGNISNELILRNI